MDSSGSSESSNDEDMLLDFEDGGDNPFSYDPPASPPREPPAAAAFVIRRHVDPDAASEAKCIPNVRYVQGSCFQKVVLISPNCCINFRYCQGSLSSRKLPFKGSCFQKVVLISPNCCINFRYCQGSLSSRKLPFKVNHSLVEGTETSRFLAIVEF
ncbi:hypothetical protein HPB47_007820 [Ixodes persulcatus]|uniref:Uncharacterized protein n=1 Tax=Ixodes persulcatus TaxID=34615 RepID=A0AC60P6F3_IXOPE|nr:hypothetical protein HPB47_007820 [Ixodes persulcatus]